MTLNNTLVSDIMDSNPLVLQPHCAVSEAIQRLCEHKVDGAPVVNEHLDLVGFFSSHDLLVHLWSNDYQTPDADLTVAELMHTKLETANPSDSVLQLAERIAIDHDQLYPVNSSGMLTAMRAGSISERAKAMKVAKPKQYPVVKNKKLIGMINRTMVIAAIQAACYPTQNADHQAA